MQIRPMQAHDWPEVEAIYAAGIAAGNATFETSTPDWETFDSAKLVAHRLVAHDGAEIVGWVAASPASARPVYAGVIEHSVYVAPAHAGRGVGAALVDALIKSTEAAGIWTIQSSIFPDDTASLRLHHRAGFRTVGVRERIAQHHGIWRDTILIERRRAD